MRLTTSSLSCAECHEIWDSKPPGTLWATPGLLWDCFTFTYVSSTRVPVAIPLMHTLLYCSPTHAHTTVLQSHTCTHYCTAVPHMHTQLYCSPTHAHTTVLQSHTCTHYCTAVPHMPTLLYCNLHFISLITIHYD